MRRAALRLSRRQVLGLGVAGAAGAVGVRLLGVGSAGSLISQPGPDGAWDSPLNQPRALAAHLLRRAGFGYTSAELDAAAQLSYSDLVDQLVSQAPEPLSPPADLTNYQQVAVAWLQHMVTTPAPLPERMAFFWHGHLTSDYRKATGTPFVYLQNVLYRTAGLSDLRTLMIRTTADPLMMLYLDLEQSTGSAPNENFAREVMEVYTLGVGNYTEDDVRAAAKGLSGLRIMMRTPAGAIVELPKRPAKGADPAAARRAYSAQLSQMVSRGYGFTGVLDPSRHYNQPVTFLGKTTAYEPTDVIDQILAQPAVASFITKAALIYFAVPSPSAALVTSIADQFRGSGYDLKTLMRSIFMSQEFRTPSNYRSLVRSPVDYCVAMMKAIGTTGLARAAFAAGQGMDQILYDMPTVAGWPTNAGWLSSASILARMNFVNQALTSSSGLPSPAAAVADQLDGVVGPDLARVYNASQSDLDRWYAVLASADFQLK